MSLEPELCSLDTWQLVVNTTKPRAFYAFKTDDERGSLFCDIKKPKVRFVFNGSGIILISPAMYIRHAWFLRVIARFYERYTNVQYRPKPGIKRRYKKFYSKIAEYEATGSYISIPVKSGLEFFHFIDHFTKPHLKDVHAPALVLQSDHDPVARPRGAKFVYDRLGSKDKKLVMIDNDEHVIISDDTRKQVYQEALKFIKTH